MYRVISIEDYMLTRNIRLENSDTGTIDGCFDDSLLVSKKCFNFMKIGKKYNCKIKLFGEAVLDMQNHTLFCKVMEHNVIIGATKMVKVLVENDEYYIEQEKLENFIKMDSFYFRYSRKDLIQVNNIIHSDLLQSEGKYEIKIFCNESTRIYDLEISYDKLSKEAITSRQYNLKESRVDNLYC